MGRSDVESVSIKVPSGEGHLIGDILRKYATHSRRSWQVIGYKVQRQSKNFSISNGVLCSYLDLLVGSLVCVDEHSHELDKDPMLVTLKWDGECYAGNGFELHKLGHVVGDTLEVCVMYERGYRTPAQNYEVLCKLFGDNASDFFAVPSAHSSVRRFSYNVQPIDNKNEWLEITAENGIINDALNHVVRSLSDINI